MDPLSVTAAVVGLIDVTSKVARGVSHIVQKMQHAPEEIRKAGEEATAMHLLFVQVQRFVQNPSLAHSSHSGLISLDHVVVTLTTCVKAFSMLDDFVRQLDSAADLNLWVRLRWKSTSEHLSAIMANIGNQRSSLEIMLTLLTGSTVLEIKDSLSSQTADISQVRDSVDKLSQLVELTLETNTFLARRLAMLEDGSINGAASVLGTSTTMSPTVPRSATLGGLAAASLWNDQLSAESPDSICPQLPVDNLNVDRHFEAILERSGPYRNALGMRDERLSFISLGDRSGTWSVLSGLSLSQISSLTIIALPIYSHDITNSDAYSFGIAETGRAMNEILNIQIAVNWIHARRRRLRALHAQLPGSVDAYALSCQAEVLASQIMKFGERLRDRLDNFNERQRGTGFSVEVYDVRRSLEQAMRRYYDADMTWCEELVEYILKLYLNVNPNASPAELTWLSETHDTAAFLMGLSLGPQAHRVGTVAYSIRLAQQAYSDTHAREEIWTEFFRLL